MLRREGILAGVEQQQRPRAVADERRPVFDSHILTVTIIKPHLCRHTLSRCVSASSLLLFILNLLPGLCLSALEPLQPTGPHRKVRKHVDSRSFTVKMRDWALSAECLNLPVVDLQS